VPKGNATKVLVGEPSSDIEDVGDALYKGQTVSAALYSGTSILSAGTATGENVEVDHVLSPLQQNEVGTIRCIGLNYRQHAAEGGMDIPSIPT
jgi:2-keto-4-pentenoate hydratase/2-oxohepta-3-ene-1,7-dioic acid hydratase in catechol pathway